MAWRPIASWRVLRALWVSGWAVGALTGCYAFAPHPVAPVLTLPDLPTVAGPVPAPATPAGWDPFTPAVTSTVPATGAPAVAEWTRTGSPGDSLVITGSNFSNITGAGSGADTQFLVYGLAAGANAIQAPAAIMRLDGAKAAVTLPNALPAWSTYFIWPMNAAGYGYPVAINRTEAWWLGPNQAAAGGTVSVYGRNLAHANGTTQSWIYLQSAAGVGQWAAVTAVNPYRVQFTVPAGSPAGVYQVWAHNGHGGRYGWSNPLTLTVVPAYAWTGDVFNVRSYGATGNGVTDDTAAILAAVRAAAAEVQQSATHPTVYFPTGTYLLEQGIPLSSNVRLLGDGMSATILRCGPQFSQGPSSGNKLGLVYVNGSVVTHVDVDSITLDANGNFSTPVNNDHLIYCACAFGSSDLHFNEVQVLMLEPGLGCVFVNNTLRLAYTDCVFIGGDVMSFNGQQHAFEGCSFYGANDSAMAIDQRGTSELSVSDCYAANFDETSATGQGLGRLLAANGDYGAQRDVYLGANTTVDCGPRPGAADQNSGEQVLSEGNSNVYQGSPVGATGNTVAFSDLGSDFTGQTAIITAGTGLGQYRFITGYNASTHTVTVAPAWNVPPDATSTVVIAYAASRWAVYNNVLDGRQNYAANTTAMAGIELFGGCCDWVCDSNTITRMCRGLYVTGLEQATAPSGISPSFFNVFTRNEVENCYQAVYLACGIPTLAKDPGTGAFGNVFRDNLFESITAQAVGIWTSPTSTPGVPLDLELIDQNTALNTGAGIDCDELGTGARTRNILMYRNSVSIAAGSSAGAFGVHFGAGTLNASVFANTWGSLGTASYAGTVPGGVLEVPLRNLSLTASGTPVTGELTIANAGTGPLAWTATSDSSWLTVGNASGNLSDETAASLAVACDPTGLPLGSYVGTVTIVSGSQSKVVTIWFTVGVSPRIQALVQSGSPLPIRTVAAQSGPGASARAAPATRATADGSVQVQAMAKGGGAELQVSDSSLIVTAPSAAPVSASIGLGSPSGTEIAWTAKSDAPWLALSAESGQVTESAPNQLNFCCRPTGLAPGAYAGTVTLTSSARIRQVFVALIVPGTAAGPKSPPSGAGPFLVAAAGVRPERIAQGLAGPMDQPDRSAESRPHQLKAWLARACAHLSGSGLRALVDCNLLAIACRVRGHRRRARLGGRGPSRPAGV